MFKGQGNSNIVGEIAENIESHPKVEDVVVYEEIATNPEQENKEELDKEKPQEPATKPEGNEKEMNFIALGEIMFGGKEYTSYSLPFKNISEICKESNFTIASLATNIVDIDEIKDPKSKYIVTKDVTKAFNTLGIDAINVATDHMMDFSLNIFNGTKNILKEENIDIVGLQNDIIYAENDGIKVAFIGVCNEIIGSYSKYLEAGICMYDDYMINLKGLINKAKQNANTVVLITHLGMENQHEVTDVMSWFYRELINAGADVVLGNHAVGVYPIEMYKGKPIIYSLGYSITDSEYEIAKKSGIFKFRVDVTGRLAEIEITPTYLKNNEVMLYHEYNAQEANKFLKYIVSDEELDYEIKNNKLYIKL